MAGEPRKPADSRPPDPPSRAREGGSATPVRRTVRPADPARGGGTPPSFTPGASRPRPDTSGAAPVVVGRGPTGEPPRTRPPMPRPGVQQPTGRPSGQEAARVQPRPGSAQRVTRPAEARPGVAPSRPSRPAGPDGVPGQPGARPPVAGRRRRTARRIALALSLLLALAIAWPIGLLIWANGQINHVAALPGTPDTTPGTTYLLAGSDVRGDEGGIPTDGTEGARTDTIMVLHVPESGPSALISLPRDTYAEIPGYGPNKLNAAYAWGGALLLVQTVEQLTGLHIDHYAEISLGGVSRIVDAVGGVELCMDPAVNKVNFPVNDPDSGMVWDAPGCKVSNGMEALSFARMRKADLEYDIGRAKRQQQLIASVSSTVADPSIIARPADQVDLIRAGLGAITVSDGTNILDMGQLALAFRNATGPEGIRGTPPISDINYQPGGVGSTVLLDPNTAPQFWADIRDGKLPPGPVGGIPQL